MPVGRWMATPGVLLLMGSLVQAYAQAGAATPATAQTTYGPLRSVYVEGKVKVDSGDSLPELAAIERVCNGIVYREGHTDSRGDFGLQLGAQNASTFLDASAGFDKTPTLGTQGSGSQAGLSERALAGCEIRANLAGYISDSITLGFRRMLDNPYIGVIYLHAISRNEGSLSSATTILAPKKAANAYEQGLKSLKKQQWQEAERQFSIAVRDYPKYAIAWFELGRLYQREGKAKDASHAFQEAIQADASLIVAYEQLAILSASDGAWEDTVRYTSRLLALDHNAGFQFYFYSAVGNHYLQNSAVALEHAREAARLDTQHRNPKIIHLMGVLLAEQGSYREAAECLRTYLALMPNAPDAAAVREQLESFEKMPVGQ